MPAQTEDARALAPLGAERGVPFHPVIHDGGKGCERLAVVDDRRAAIETDSSREGWFQAWIATSPFERFHQRAFFAADVRARAAMHDDFERKIAAQNVLADVACLVGLLDGARHLPPGQRQLAAHINKGS